MFRWDCGRDLEPAPFCALVQMSRKFVDLSENSYQAAIRVASRCHLSYAPEDFGEMALIGEARREPDFEDAQIGVSQHSLSAFDTLSDHVLVGTDASAASEELTKMVLAHPCD